MLKQALLFVCLCLFCLSASAQDYQVGDKVSIEWKGSWFQGKILEVGNGLYKVSYDGYGAEWNEFVTKGRIRPVTDLPPKPESHQPTNTGSDISYKGVETIWDLDRSKDGTCIFAASSLGSVLVLNASDLSLINEIKTGKEPLQSVSVSADGIYLAVGKMQGSLVIYKKTGDAFSEWVSVPDYFSISRLRFAPAGYELAVSASPKENYKNTLVDIWNVEKKAKTRTLVKSSNDQCLYSDISWSADGSLIALGISNAKKGIEVYNVSSGQLTARIPHTSDVISCVFSADGKRIVSGGTDQKVTLWDLGTKTPAWKFTWGKSGMDYVYGITFSPDGNSIAVCGTGTGKVVEVIDVSTGKVKKVAGSSNPGGNAVRFSADGTAVFVAFTTYGNAAKVPVVQKFGIN